MKDYIAVDWGSTQLRGWLIRNGQCVGTKQLPLGITRLNGRAPADVFAEHLAPWRGAEALPVLMAGMIGSDAGWQAVPYLDCPAAIDAPGQQLCAVAEGVWIIPGLKIAQGGEFNVMRGEETQLLGAWQLAPAECYVLPGTHCKWVQVTDGMVRHFATAMTGELHHLLMTQSLIGKGLPARQADEAAFEQGLEKGLAQPSLISELFAARAARVLGALAATSVSDYLSGLLIGAEVATLGQRYRTSGVTLVGDPALNARYSRAMRACGMTVNSCSGDEALLGGMARIMHGQD
ncbi:2-dehydro-3-deoxygalactonokinase [Klebsiella michiganensis]|uniref:2-dehydro-3-deoxygalactonokinase n=1 Tax=Klebsiella michiganensis TaxID=1134687 RepID=UPI0012B9033A|nr:2-dehydro-3-deoxygalactonokinase [Klebsiella michiganensis]CAE7345825.1 putative 2-dehydro-3-deoxygalactonokinase DgoK1 [Klebsiella oxytoca]ELK6574042.1 2-dehydro-3-deoxygalactonokinase [Klebsiella michiganensis]MDU3733455.1 2-dehydro-3-deoxygalactonokinase [Klebsiella michiganensis]CAH3849561.1 putative 2-dehydro-3-deoxygalactonokinase DgoK1 [Klebsiella oxytoca]HCJ7650487.1 2-dehydro-3-deoxygalactonokinase [Klebsiella michiganensis]